MALRATKHKARAVGRSVAGFVSVEHHLWLTITDIKEKDKKTLGRPYLKRRPVWRFSHHSGGKVLGSEYIVIYIYIYISYIIYKIII